MSEQFTGNAFGTNMTGNPANRVHQESCPSPSGYPELSFTDS